MNIILNLKILTLKKIRVSKLNFNNNQKDSGLIFISWEADVVLLIRKPKICKW